MNPSYRTTGQRYYPQNHHQNNIFFHNNTSPIGNQHAIRYDGRFEYRRIPQIVTNTNTYQYMHQTQVKDSSQGIAPLMSRALPKTSQYPVIKKYKSGFSQMQQLSMPDRKIFSSPQLTAFDSYKNGYSAQFQSYTMEKNKPLTPPKRSIQPIKGCGFCDCC